MSETIRSESERRYADRHGRAWRLKTSPSSAGTWSLEFLDDDIRLLAEGPIERDPTSLSEAEVKDLFCDAERLLVEGRENWYVGYRARPMGRQGRFQGGLCTRFRSEGGEVKYSRDMLDFRHMPEAALRERLAEVKSSR